MQQTLHQLLAAWMQFVLDYGYLGVFVMMIFESTALPVPAEVVIPPAWAFLHEATPAHAAYLLLDGDASVYRGRHQVATVTAGEVFGLGGA